MSGGPQNDGSHFGGIPELQSEKNGNRGTIVFNFLIVISII